MADKNSVPDWSATPASNDNIAGIPLAEGVTLPSHLNNAIRALMAQIKSLLSNLVLTGSLGVGIAPAGPLANGKGIALGDTDSGIRQNGDGIVELVSNGITVLSANGSVGGGTVSMRGNRAVQAYDGGNDDATVSGNVWASVDFVALGNSIIATGTCQINQTGGTPTLVYARIQIRDLTTNVIAGAGYEARVRSQLADSQAGPVCHAAYAVLTVGRTYRIELFVRKADATGPVLIQDRSISAIHV